MTPAATGRLNGKVAVVAGIRAAGDSIDYPSAIGSVVALHGAAVVVVDIDRLAAEAEAERLRSDGAAAIAVAGDLTEERFWTAASQLVAREYGVVHVLVNAITDIGPIEDLTHLSVPAWDRSMVLNVRSAMLACRNLIPLMGPGGSVVNISSIAAIRAPALLAYATTKGATMAMTTALAGAHGRDGVRVNSVIPGQAWSPLALVHARGKSPSEVSAMRRRRRLATLLKTEGTAWDIAQAVLFLASDDARWITGQALVVDGGTSVRRP